MIDKAVMGVYNEIELSYSFPDLMAANLSISMLQFRKEMNHE